MVGLQELISLIETCVNNLTSNNSDIDFVITQLDFIIDAYRNWGTFLSSQRVLQVLESAQQILLRYQNCNNIVNQGRGRPRIEIPIGPLEYLLSINFKVTQIAKMYSISKETIFRRLKENGLSVTRTYTVINDNELYMVINRILRNHPNTGYKRMRGYLRSENVKVTERRVRETMREVDPQGVELRRTQNRAIVRRSYFVEHFNDMWHIDTNMKLIRWNIVIRGGVDGKSRTCVFLNCSSDNRANSNLLGFLDGVSRYGVPQRTRTDKGKENVLIARYMLETRGCNRASHICGQSVHNQRIERFWKDVTYGCTGLYKLVFSALEEDGLLNVDNASHVYILHKIFIPRINAHLKEFSDGWNNHPVSTENNYSPKQLMLLHQPPAGHNLMLNEEDMEIIDLLCNTENELVNFDFEEDIRFPLLPENTLTREQQNYLDTLDAMGDSRSYGYDIFERAVNYIVPQ